MTAIGPTAGDQAELRTAGDLPVLTWPGLDRLGVEAVVTTRAGGVSTGPYESLNLGLHVGDDPDAVTENRRRAAAAVSATLDHLVLGTQVHGRAVTVVGAADAGRGARRPEDAVPGTDGLVTTAPGVVLAVLAADCVPMLLVDPEARVLATVHAGWRGTVAGVVEAAVAAMADLGARPDRLVASIGPAVSARTYVVGPEVADGVSARLGERAVEVLVPHGPGRWLLDLPAATLLQLLGAGVTAGAVRVAPFTTAHHAFFSDRAHRPCGRFGLLARIR